MLYLRSKFRRIAVARFIIKLAKMSNVTLRHPLTDMPIKKTIWVALLMMILAVVAIMPHKQFGNTGDRIQDRGIQAGRPLYRTGGWERKSVSSSINQQNTAKKNTDKNAVAQTPQAVVAPQLSAKRLLAHIKALAKERYTDRDRTRTRDYIVQVLKASGWSPTLQSFEGFKQ